MQVCLQVKLDDLQDRGGANPKDILTLAEEVSLHDNLKLRGIMVLPPPKISTQDQKKIFKTARQLGETLIQQGHSIDTYSMGMTQDLESAIAEGATMVRIGSGIFGKREKT